MDSNNIWTQAFPSYNEAEKVPEGCYIVGLGTPKHLFKMMRIKDSICIGFTDSILLAYSNPPAFDIIFEENFTKENYIKACEFWINEITQDKGE